MAKSVFNARQLPHEWAHNVDADRIGRNPQGNYHFKGGVLYSYAEPIACRIPARKGEDPIFLFRDCHFSITTSRHQSRARSAAFGARLIAHVADMGEGRFSRGFEKLDHKRNLNHFAKRIQEATIAFARCRPANKEWKLNSILREINNANRYAEVFKLRTRFAAPSEEEAKAVLADAKDRLARESAAAAKKREEMNAANAAAHAAYLAELMVKLPKWLAGESINLEWHGLREATGRQTDYMRVEGENLVTNRGASVPLHHAKRAIGFVLRVLDDGKVWTSPPEKTLQVGSFAINRIDGEIGLVSVGCHTFDAQEVRRIAALLA